ncbi:MAG: gluconate 2-dehydrogenase gamma chain [Halioglobus sp.]|jgi:gluconate 2-dehydrogenase gamma chain
MNRREFLQCAAVLAAGSVALPSSWVLSEEQSTFIAGQRNYIDRSIATFFTPQQRATVAAIAEQIIPATDTPGAADAGAGKFIELMVADWFTEEERALFMSGLTQLESESAVPFASLGSGQQLSLLEQLEDDAGDSTWYNLGNVTRIWDESAPFICQMKELTVLGFMLSEVGSTEFLRENLMGTFDGGLPLSPEDPAYAAELPLRLMARG